MKRNALILILLISNLTFSQTEKLDLNSEIEFRQLTGNLVDEYGKPFPGQNIIIKGTNIGTQTDFDGNFCLIIPKNKTVFIELPFCFDQIFREIKPTDNSIELRTGKSKHKTKKARRNYNKIKAELNTDLSKIYNSAEYNMKKNICG